MSDKSIAKNITKEEQYDTLFAFCNALAWAESSDLIYYRIVETAALRFGYEESHIHLINAEGTQFTRLASYGNEPPAYVHDSRFSITVGRASLMLQSGDPILTHYTHPHPEDWIPQEAVKLGVVHSITIPLIAPSSDVIGMLSVVGKTEKQLHPEQALFYRDIGELLGTHLDRILKTRKAIELTILEERKQLSSELHDNVSQLVSPLHIYADTALAFCEEQNYEGMRDTLARLSSLSFEITNVMRQEMLSLRMTHDEKEDFAITVDELLKLFGWQWELTISFEVVPEGKPIYMRGLIAQQVIRILNEALSNIYKHSKATKVDVCLFESGSNVVLIVDDNGVGFDVDSVPNGHLGIKIMHERASAAKGKLYIESCEKGTTVCVSVPNN